MADVSVRETVATCFGRSGALSVVRDLLGVYGINDITNIPSNPRGPIRSVRERLNLLRTRPFVRVAVVTVRPEGSSLGHELQLQRNLDDASEMYLKHCGVWIHCMGVALVHTSAFGPSVIIDQDDNSLTGIPVFSRGITLDEFFLFSMGRDLGADIVAYYIGGSVNQVGGNASHPPGRRGFWVTWTIRGTLPDGTPSPQSRNNRFGFAHELGHLLIGHGHRRDSDNLMFRSPTWTTRPPLLTDGQADEVQGDKALERCSLRRES